ncbi:GNAT family N-acetyltransferase [Photobacterium satsumensis]|uniref:GNAT family N-acetyltransferase n=1 Tax=Photobacterium satsumensis TaxID=2910239 RepID=UPI003D0C719B
MQYSTYQHRQSEEIIQLFSQTFSDSEGIDAGKVIGDLVTELLATTEKNDLFVFVATDEDKIVGSILFTRLTFESDKSTFLMAPVAVDTQSQGKGIGQALIKFGLDTLQQQGIDLAFTYGDPNFYSKIGFECITEQQFKAPLPLSQPHGWLAQSLTAQPLEPIAGNSSCVAAFNKPEMW